MNTYRVLMQDTHNGEKFHFAVTIKAIDDFGARWKAGLEFRSAKAVSAVLKRLDDV